ncbi:hypothetical protein K9M41_01975 [Candidatus Gracilibacteria bacterium]|nr:hypothetical protein [Candidatus Gracilibacteria bacterium]
MPVIIPKSEFQKNIGKISRNMEAKLYIITDNGKAGMAVLPYFEEGDDIIANYLENYEMWENREKLCKKYRKASKSGESDFVI